MISFDDAIKENIKEYNPNWPEVSDHPYRTLIAEGSGSGKTNALFNLINYEPDIDQIYLHAKDPYEEKNQFLIIKWNSKSLKHFNNSKVFVEYLNDMDNIYKNIVDYNQNKKRKILIVFDDIITDMHSNERLDKTVTELSIRGRKLAISLVFNTQAYLKLPNDVRLSTTHFFIMKIPNKREPEQVAYNHSSDIDFKDFMNLCKICTAKII